MRRVLILLVFVIASPLTHSQKLGETLIKPLPAGYVVARQISLRMSRVVWMVPEGQSIDKFTEILVATTFVGDRDKSLDNFYSGIKRQWPILCKSGQFSPYVSSAQNGYPAIAWSQHCNRHKVTGKPEVTLTKAISGDDNFYVVQKSFKYFPAQLDMEKWSRYLESVTVCNAKNTSQSCTPRVNFEESQSSR